jgi:hypothetical protein
MRSNICLFFRSALTSFTSSCSPFADVQGALKLNRRHVLLVLVAVLILTGCSSGYRVEHALGEPIESGPPATAETGEAESKPNWKRKTDAETYPVVSILRAITNNRLVLSLRFHGVVKALRKEVDIGPL